MNGMKELLKVKRGCAGWCDVVGIWMLKGNDVRAFFFGPSLIFCIPRPTLLDTVVLVTT